jgi:hypothetical protein
MDLGIGSVAAVVYRRLFMARIGIDSDQHRRHWNESTWSAQTSWANPRIFELLDRDLRGEALSAELPFHQCHKNIPDKLGTHAEKNKSKLKLYTHIFSKD